MEHFGNRTVFGSLYFLLLLLSLSSSFVFWLSSGSLSTNSASTCKLPFMTSALTFPPTPLVFDVAETVHTPLQLAPKSITCACKDGSSLSLSLSLSSRIPTEFDEDENQDFTSLVVKFSHSISVRDTTILSSNVEKLSFGIFNCNECNHFRKSSSLSCSSFSVARTPSTPSKKNKNKDKKNKKRRGKNFWTDKS